MNRVTWNLLALINIVVWVTQTAIACFVYVLVYGLAKRKSQWALRQLEITGKRNEWLIEEGKKLGL